MAPPKRTTRNPELIPGVRKISRSKMYHKRGLFAIKAKNGGKFPHHEKAPAAAPVAEKPPKFYPADDVKKPLLNKRKAKPTKLRASITPGTVLIILTGRFRGKRVVFLKQLTSGLLLITGPYKINGVPLRRVNQAYVIGTSTKINGNELQISSFTQISGRRHRINRSDSWDSSYGFSSRSSSSSFRRPTTPPLTVPFSWEKIPGIPKHQLAGSKKKKEEEEEDSENLLLPPQPAASKRPEEITPCKKSSRLRRDPFLAALVECSRDGGDDDDPDHHHVTMWKSGCKGIVTRSFFSDWFISFVSYSSCKGGCAVSDSTVYVRSNIDS